MKKYVFSLCCAVMIFGIGLSSAAAADTVTEQKINISNFTTEFETPNVGTSSSSIEKSVPCQDGVSIAGCIPKNTSSTDASNSLGTQKSFESKIDLYAPFAKSGSGIFCKTPLKTGQTAKSGDGSFNYQPASSEAACTAAGGVLVQRLETAGGSEAILGSYLRLVYLYVLGIGAAASVLMIVYGGITIILAFGSSDAVKKGMDKIQQGAIGIAILILAAAFLQVINPNFFTFK